MVGLYKYPPSERTQSACNSVALGKDFNSVGLACGKCVGTMQKGIPSAYGCGLGITVSKGQETARRVSEHSRPLSSE